MKIIYLGDYDSGEIINAPVKVGQSLFYQLLKTKNHIWYLPYFQDGNKYSRFQKFFGNQLISKNVIRVGIFSLLFFVSRFKPHIIHIQTSAVYYLILLLLKPLFSYKIVSTFHALNSYVLPKYSNLNYYQKSRLLIIEKTLLKYSDICFIYSNRDKRFITRYLGLDSRKLIVADNGINVLDVKKLNYSIKEPIKIAFVGYKTRGEKNLDLLINTLSELKYSIILSVYSHLNRNSYSEQLNNNLLVKYYEALNEVELRNQMKENDILIASSKYDSFNISVLEAMNTGLITLISNRVGLGERFPQKFAKLIYNYKNHSLLKDKIEAVLNMRKKERELLAMQLIEFSKRYSWEYVSRQILTIYEELVSDK